MATGTKPTKVFAGLRCPSCGDLDTLSVKIDTLELECNECSEEITKEGVDAMIDRWTKLFAWIGAASEFAAK